MKGKKAAIVGAISGLLVLASGTVGFGLGRDGRQAAVAAGGGADTPQANVAGTTMNAEAPVGTAPAASARDIAGKVATSFPGPEFPGLPPYPAQAPESNGVHAVGVAYRQTDNPDAKPGQDLVHQAFEDAGRQARELADAAGVKLGALVAVSDVKQTQPFYRACVDPIARAQEGAKPPAPDTPAILPAPVPDCSPTWYVVAWVFVRYELV